MEYRALGTTGIEVSRVALGCGNFGGVGSAPAFFGQGESEEEAFALMDAAWELGITLFDTADAYGGGRSERAIGRWLARRGPEVRERLVLSTKVFHSVEGDPDDRGLAPDRIRRQIDGSLARLGASGSTSTSPTRPTGRRPSATRSRLSTGSCAPARCGR
jgi:1-deoxyxylulose-5-phosphate synthase